MEQLKSDIKNYLLKEVSEIGKPINPSKKQVYKFQNLEVLIELLFDLIEFEVEEPSLQRVQGNFFNHIKKILDFNEQELPNAIEGLATNFEPFLKLLAYLKYADTELWEGDKKYSAGIKKTTLFNLTSGKIDNIFSAPEETPLKSIPEPLIASIGFQRTIVDFVRTELRNAVHNAKLYSRMELMHYSNVVLSCYLFVINDNLFFLKKKFFAEFVYLQKVINDRKYISLDKVYVELLGKQDFNDIDVFGTELIDEDEMISNLSSFQELVEEEILDDEIENLKEEARIDNILNIVNDTNHLEIIGHPGSGKSTTLLKILYNNSKSILEGDSEKKIPFFINANEFSTHNSFVQILSNQINEEWINEKLLLGELQILIDGLNEISAEYRYDAYKEINLLINNYSECSFILSERKINFERRFDIPVFELKDLNESQIKIFIENYSRSNFSQIWNQLQKDKNMLKLAQNPLMLKMILAVSKTGIIPKNRGLLFELFINSIFKREKFKQKQILLITKIDILSHIAFEMRKESKVSIPIAKFKMLISEKLTSLNSSVSVNIIYKEILDNLIIHISANENISFFHETYQEYFCALQIKNIYDITDELKIKISDNKWFESLLICSELIKDTKRSISFFKFIYRGQKEINDQKNIESYDENNFNENTIVACKIAHSIKLFKPEVYTLAKRYLSNDMILWKYIYYKKDIRVFPIQNLFGSIASLNSSELIYRSINDFGWAYIWLFSEKEEESNSFFVSFLDVEKNQQTKLIINSIRENTPIFGNFYKIINQSVRKYNFSLSIYSRLQNLKLKLIKGSSENELKEYYKKNKDFDVFKEILSSDYNILNGYKFDSINYDKNIEILNILIRKHLDKVPIQKLLFENRSFISKIEKITNVLLKKLYLIPDKNIFFRFMEYFLKNVKSIFNEHIDKLQSLPFSLLSNTLQNYFLINNPKIIIPYEKFDKTKFLIKKQYEKYIFKDGMYLVNNKDVIPIISLGKDYFKGNAIITLEHNSISQLSNIEKSGVIIIMTDTNYFKFRYINFRITKSSKFYEFELDNTTAVNIYKRDINTVIVNDEKNWIFKNRGFKNIEDPSFIYALTDSKYLKKNNLKFPEKGSLIYHRLSIDLNSPKKYHPDNIILDKEIMARLKSNLHSIKYTSFIKQLGISSYFHKKIDDINYGIIVNIPYGNIIKIFSTVFNKIIDFHISKEDIELYQLEKVVVIENKYKVSLISVKDEYIDKIGYVKSKIVTINLSRKEGFIEKMKLDNSESGDYYFNFISCNFSPELNDSVKFIPSRNHIKQYLNKPVALKIHKIIFPKCKIIYSDYSIYDGYIRGKAIDTVTEEPLAFRLKSDNLQDIESLTEYIKKDQIFEYKIFKVKYDDPIKIVYLTKFISNN